MTGWLMFCCIPVLVGYLKQNPSGGCVDSTIWMHHVYADCAYREKAWRELPKNATSHIEQILEVTIHEATATYLLSLKPCK